MTVDLDPGRIAHAATVIDPVFVDTPQYVDPGLTAVLGREVVVKLETLNPLRSFKGRGAEYLLHHRPDVATLVCASSGNFGQGIAYAGRRRGYEVVVFVADGINPVKRDRMAGLGARVVPVPGDEAAAGAAAQEFAAESPDRLMVVDGKEPAIAEGAGTIGVELLRGGPLDTIVLPVGDGALITGVACWVRAHSPGTRIVGVTTAHNPVMAASWRAGHPVAARRDATIAEGISIHVPVAESVARMRALVDDMVLVEDTHLMEMMDVVARTLGVLLEPAGAAGLAAIAVHQLPGDAIATVLTGANPRP